MNSRASSFLSQHVAWLLELYCHCHIIIIHGLVLRFQSCKVDAEPVSVQVEATTTTRKTTPSTTVKPTTAKSTTVRTSTAKSTTMRSTTAKSTTVKSTTEVAEDISSSSPRSTTLPEKPLEVDVMTEKRDFPAPTIIGARQGALLSPGEVKFVTDNFSCFQFFCQNYCSSSLF